MVIRDVAFDVVRNLGDVLQELFEDCGFSDDAAASLGEFLALSGKLQNSQIDHINLDENSETAVHVRNMISAISNRKIVEVNDKSNPTVNEEVTKYDTMTKKNLKKARHLYKQITGVEIKHLTFTKLNIDANQEAISEQFEGFRDDVADHCVKGIRALASVIDGLGSG